MKQQPQVGMTLNLNDGEQIVKITAINNGIISFDDGTWLYTYQWEPCIRDGCIRVVPRG